MWKVFRRLSCVAYVIHVSMPYSSVLMTQAMYTAILVFTVSFFFFKQLSIRNASSAVTNLYEDLPTTRPVSTTRMGSCGY